MTRDSGNGLYRAIKELLADCEAADHANWHDKIVDPNCGEATLLVSRVRQLVEMPFQTARHTSEMCDGEKCPVCQCCEHGFERKKGCPVQAGPSESKCKDGACMCEGKM